MKDIEQMREQNRPTHVGMNRMVEVCEGLARQPPHARGDEPQTMTTSEIAQGTAPRTWG